VPTETLQRELKWEEKETQLQISKGLHQRTGPEHYMKEGTIGTRKKRRATKAVTKKNFPGGGTVISSYRIGNFYSKGGEREGKNKKGGGG